MSVFSSASTGISQFSPPTSMPWPAKNTTAISAPRRLAVELEQTAPHVVEARVGDRANGEAEPVERRRDVGGVVDGIDQRRHAAIGAVADHQRDPLLACAAAATGKASTRAQRTPRPHRAQKRAHMSNAPSGHCRDEFTASSDAAHGGKVQ